MLIVDVLKTVGQLASAISQKTRELEELKQQYESKIHILNKYIEKIQRGPHDNSAKSQESITNMLDTPLRCSACQNTVYDLETESDYILVPKNKAHLLKEEPEKDMEPLPKLDELSVYDSGNADQNPYGSSSRNPLGNSSRSLQGNPSQNDPYEKPKKASKKKTCSYCHQAGHSRARCLTRLNKEPQGTPSI